MLNNILEIKNLSVSFPSQDGFIRVVKNINFSIEKSQCVGLVGESGSGKSITALAIVQLLPYGALVNKNSEIIFNNCDLLNFTEKEMRNYRGKKIGMIFQDAMSALNPVMLISSQMDEVLRSMNLSAVERKERALHWLDEVGIKNVKRCYESYPHQLSGGMRQRAMIAMALCSEPEIIIADEPTTALDVTIQAQVLKLLLRLKKERNLTLLFITHDLAVVSQIADKIVVMKKGELVEENSVNVFFKNQKSEYSRKLLESIPSNEPRKKEIFNADTLLCVKNLKVYFNIGSKFFKNNKDIVKAVDDVSFKIFQGETLALVGESGSGKTTVAKAIMNLVDVSSGVIDFNKVDINLLKYSELRKIRTQMQIIFQDPYVSLNPRRMIAESIIEGMQAQKIVRNRKKQLFRVDELLTLVGLSSEYKWRYPHEFSGGEKQRICIARALALQPKLLILDEPTSALDVSIQMQILKLLEDLQNEYNISYLLITHNIAVVAHLSHHLAVMHQGKIVEHGTTIEVLKNPQDKYTQRLLSSIPLISGGVVV